MAPQDKLIRVYVDTSVKTFDSVQLMRDPRAKISQEMEQITPEERIRYIQDKAASIALGRTLAGQDRDTAQH